MSELHVGDVLLNKRVGERMVIVGADEDNVWVRLLRGDEKFTVIDGSVWVRATKSERHRCSQRYAQAVFEMEASS